MKRNPNLVMNLPCDGLENAVITSFAESEDFYKSKCEEYISDLFDSTPVGKVFLNVCYKRSVVHSETADTFLYNIKRGPDGLPEPGENGKAIKLPVPDFDTSMFNRKFKPMLERNIDIIKMALDSCKKRDIDVWFSFRMNDHHFPDDPAFNSSFHYDNADIIGVNGSKMYIDYTKEAVRNYYRNYIKELCENYDIGGIEFDFLRSCPVMSEVNTQNIDLINECVKSLKDTINAVAVNKGKKIQTAVRVYPEVDMNLKYGLDVIKWVADGLVDILVLEGWYVPTYFDIPVEKWRESIKRANVNNYPYKLLCGLDVGVECDSTEYKSRTMWTTIPQIRGFSSSAYNRGADGIYFFNQFITHKSAETYYIPYYGGPTVFTTDKNEKGFVLNEKLNSANSLEAAETGERSYVHTYKEHPNDIYPVILSHKKDFTFVQNTGTKPDKGYYNVIVGIDNADGCDENLIDVYVNGYKARQISDISRDGDFVWADADEPFKYVDHVSEVAYRVMRFTVDGLAAVKNGANTIKLCGVSPKHQIVRWLEIQVYDEK